ncbi:MAG: M48 family metallopeptidase [Thermoleophilaceae bacterium]|nr:M48 family metallopeptidase [Thermoleophilaceae bacterium]
MGVDADVVYEGEGFDYSLRRSTRAKNIRITVGTDGVVLTLPGRTAERHGHEFIRERSDWIARTLAKIEAADEIVASRSLSDGTTVPFVGWDLVLRLLDGPSGRVTLKPASGELWVRVPDTRRETVAAALERWYRRQAKEVFAERLDAVVARNGTSYERVAIRDQKTRWGSCSSSGTISFNWRLLLAPESVMDYVIEHEAAHIEVRDHSARFWALMDQRVSDWRDSRLWLKRHGGTLRLT